MTAARTASTFLNTRPWLACSFNVRLKRSATPLVCGIVSTAPFAVRLLTVDAVNQEAVLNFYPRTGFIESLSEKKERQSQKVRDTILMFKDLYRLLLLLLPQLLLLLLLLLLPQLLLQLLLQ